MSRASVKCWFFFALPSPGRGCSVLLKKVKGKSAGRTLCADSGGSTSKSWFRDLGLFGVQVSGLFVCWGFCWVGSAGPEGAGGPGRRAWTRSVDKSKMWERGETTPTSLRCRGTFCEKGLFFTCKHLSPRPAAHIAVFSRLKIFIWWVAQQHREKHGRRRQCSWFSVTGEKQTGY